ncbi:MAG TPA: hypothetical protein VEC12_04520 [Bacteroidia bacterium]|nr:hypothetical protein [Bacteroidia bacterium]
MRTLFAALFVAVVTNSFCQADSLRQLNRPDSAVAYHYKHRMDTLYFKQDAVRFTYHYNGGHLITAGYTIERLNYLLDVPTPTNRIGPTISAGLLMRNKNSYFSASLAYSAHIYLVYGAINTHYFTDFNKGSFYIVPEIGFSAVGMLYIGYSRYINITDPLNLKLKNQVTVGFNIPIPYTARKYYILGKRAKYLDRRM